MSPPNSLHQALRTVDFQLPAQRDTFPFSISSFQETAQLEFHPNVTFFVGENGSGKSTLLEAIAELVKLPIEGGSDNFARGANTSALAKQLVLTKGAKRPKTAFFMRAESFFNVASAVDDLGVGSFGEKSLHAQSHGESFLALLEHRFWPGGLYLMDEPEAALSPLRQLSFLAYLHRFVGEGSQFIIATHSPILLAYPESDIYYFGGRKIERIAYEQTEHYSLTFDFLKNRKHYLERLFRPTDR